ncbi:MAG TPA: mannosyltransferase family protein, partial [Anaerolineales bacterium]|nr:mannosyltransferase family protein [Anaerolineales bacterium]
MKRLPDWLTIPLLAFVLSRLLIFGAGILGDTMLPTEEGHWVADESSPFLSMWAKWDSQYYVDIATNGYWFRPGQQSNVAFFPLYPMTVQVLSKFFDGKIILTGFLVSNLAFFGALIFFYLLTELELGSDSAKRAVYYLAFFPTSFFFSSVYTESMFVLLSIATM